MTTKTNKMVLFVYRDLKTAKNFVHQVLHADYTVFNEELDSFNFQREQYFNFMKNATLARPMVIAINSADCTVALMQRYFNDAASFNYDLALICEDEKLLNRLTPYLTHPTNAFTINNVDCKWLNSWLHPLSVNNVLNVQNDQIIYHHQTYDAFNVFGDVQGVYEHGLNAYNYILQHPNELFIFAGDYFDLHLNDALSKSTSQIQHETMLLTQTFIKLSKLDNVIFVKGNHDYALMLSLWAKTRWFNYDNKQLRQKIQELKNRYKLHYTATMEVWNALYNNQIQFFKEMLNLMYQTYHNEVVIKNNNQEIVITHAGIKNCVMRHHDFGDPINANLVQFGSNRAGSIFNKSMFYNSPDFLQIVGHYHYYDEACQDLNQERIICTDASKLHQLGMLHGEFKHQKLITYSTLLNDTNQHVR